MKTTQYLPVFLIFFLFFAGSPSYTQAKDYKKIIIVGQVMDSVTGMGIENMPVTVESKIIFFEQSYFKQTVTNERGYFFDTITVYNQQVEKGEISFVTEYEGEAYRKTHYFRLSGRSDYLITPIFEINANISVTTLQANFTYTNYNSNFNSSIITFSDRTISENPVLSWHWDFGDGTESSLQNPSHNYEEEGIYNVKLTVTSQSSKGELLISKIYHPVRVYKKYETQVLWGQVFLGESYVPQSPDLGYVYLYRLHGDSIEEFDSQVLTHIETDSTEFTGYAFLSIPEGKYIVKVELDPSTDYFDEYFTTYYGNVQQSSEATVIEVLYQPEIGFININLLEAGELSPGEIKATGQIIDARKGKEGVPNAYIYLTTTDNIPLLCTISDEKGIFSFDDLPNGTYKIYADITGLPCEPIIFQVKDDMSGVGPLQFIVTPEGIIGKPYGVEEIQDGTVSMQAFPNPFSNILTVKTENNKTASVDIYNLTGRIIYHTDISGYQEVKLNTADWNSGVYFIKIKSGNTVSVQKLIKK